MSQKNLKMIGTILSFAGGVIAFFASLSYFFEGNFMPHFNYNKIDSQVGETLTVIGILIFIIAVTTLVISLFGFKRQNAKFLFVSLIILGAFILALLPFAGVIANVIATFTAGILIIAGGIMGDIANRLE